MGACIRAQHGGAGQRRGGRCLRAAFSFVDSSVGVWRGQLQDEPGTGAAVGLHYLPSEIEKFKDATGYEEFLDFDPAVIKAALEDPDKSHVDEMLAFAEQAGREYEAELAGTDPGALPG